MKKLLLFLLTLLTFNLYSQKEANTWYFGRNAGIDFNTSPPSALTDGKLNTDEGCSTISDENGNLLFYSDGIKVWTARHELMRYSDGRIADNLQGNPSSSQSGLIVPNPEDKNIYYIFTVGTDFVGNSGYPRNPGFNYYTVDIDKGDGGEIIAGPINLSDGRDAAWSEKISAVQGKDCTEFWILSIVQDTFYAYKIDKNGIDSSNPITSPSSYFLNDKRGYLKVSPNGNKVALADFNPSGSLVLYDFDNLTGKIISNGVILTSPTQDGAPYGVEFSQESRKLYASNYSASSNSNKVFQFNLLTTDIAQSKTLITEQNGFRGALQLGPNQKIYFSLPGGSFLGAINNIEEEPNNVTYNPQEINLNGQISSQGLPPFIQSFFAPVNLIDTTTGNVLNNTNQTFCIGDSYMIEPELNLASSTYTWFKDGTEIAKTRILTTNNTNFGSGLYEVKIESTSECGKTYTGKIQINFEPKPSINKIPTYIQCDFDSNTVDGFASFNLESKEIELVNNTSNLVFDFFETSDITFQNPINKNNYTNTIATNHTVMVRVTNTITKCYQTELIDLQVNPTGLTSYNDEYLCELDKNTSDPDAKFSIGTNNSIFNFDSKTQQIINDSGGALSEATHNFEYYRTSNDASLQINQITPPYEDYLFKNNSDVYVRVSNKGVNSCEAVGRFKIFVEKIPAPQGNLDKSILCIDNPRMNPQLRTIELNADTGNSSDTYKWYLDGFLIPGETNAIHNANSAGEYKVEAYRVYPNINQPCIGYNTFYVKESNKALIVSIKSTDDNDNPINNKIEIIVNGIGDYEYALNSTSLSDFTKGDKNLTFTFTEIPPGLNSISIRDRNDCGIVSSEQISTIYFQRHLTPNGDTHNDTWNILGVDNDFYQSVNVQIFDRYGKLIKTITDKNDPGWDGIYNGKILPSNDYWYNAELLDINGKIRKKSGHFSLLRK
ncbi:T9SS type B sorting domain-containing protein [Tenacibaculum sp. S7007]|uniref:T9SS type B sorting domain-containing protein n=1 Tax=Tenacibaculum pelagium TaxID=2759527 RepID=A0A839ASD3_9FLAO|nr:T9SS type B sorting domain-containing protein [Tenacibaculum pelagium]MBA6156551.1 T9SS type B sorting domain-containing protein [Tenacibaculum pelagium]